MRVFLLFIFIATLSACSTEPEEQQETSVAVQADGPHVEHYDNGQVKVEGQYRKGERDGLWTAYYPSGLKWSAETYLVGKRNGPSTSYFENGFMRYHGNYRNDKRYGKWYFYNEEGAVDQEKDFGL